MREYTFVYFDSVFEFNDLKRSYYHVNASRFSVAFKSFCNFIKNSCFYYFNFENVYYVKHGDSVHCRVLPNEHYSTLDLQRKL